MFVKRDEKGQIVAVSAASQPGFEEQIDPADADVLAFLNAMKTDDPDEVRQLQSSDTDLARVVEDIINLLTDKGVIQFTELPKAAQQKLLQRKTLRKNIRRLQLVDDDSDDLMI
jgi:hypothetical protein